MYKKYATLLSFSLILMGCGNGSADQSKISNTNQNQFHGINVPPEPDAILNSITLTGIDSDKNGVRDDVDRQIAAMYGNNAEHYDGALRVAKSDQGFLIADGDVAKSTQATIAAATAGFCLYSKLRDDGILANKEINKISPLTFNSAERLASYKKTVAASLEVNTPVPSVPCQ
jgi:hypothetical protein